MKIKAMMLSASALLLGLTLSQYSLAADLDPSSYAMPNGGTGVFVYFDQTYNGTGDNTTDCAPLSGGTGDLTDDIIAATNWDDSGQPSSDPYVGWNTNDAGCADPAITFNFAALSGFESVTLYLDDSGSGNVSPPTNASVTVGANSPINCPISDPAGTDPFSVVCNLQGLTGDQVTIVLTHRTDWIMLSEVQFDGGLVPANDRIAGSITVAPPSDTPMTAAGSTLYASDDVAEAGTSFCGTALTTGGVWYDFVADGPIAGRITATTCSAVTDYDSKVSIFKGTPGSLECVGGNDDDFDCAAGIFDSTFAWTATAGENYYVLVHGFGSAQGPFELTLDASGAGAEARVIVSKSWSDSPNSTPVTVNLSCNDGFVSQDGTAEISEGSSHTFVITNLLSTDVNCEVSEVSAENYTQTYNANDGQATSCVFDADPGTGEALLQTVNTCQIRNTADDATYSVTKEWMIINSGGNVIQEEVYVTIECDAYIDGGSSYTKSAWLGDGDTLSADVSTLTGPAMCKASEDIVQSGVESENGCASYETLTAGETYGCTIYNSVFFEGIPTLSQYGLALMALLMLGVGFIGFRRFI